MTHLPCNEELAALAQSLVWFEDPAKALADPARLFAYAMRYGTRDEVKTLREYLSDDDLRRLLPSVPPGIVDGRSWAYWHLKLGQYPPPPLPSRTYSRSDRSIIGGA